MDKLREADAVVQCLGEAIQDGESGLSAVPGLLLRLITENLWQERVIRCTGEMVRFTHFAEFVHTQPLEGLGTDVQTLKRLCRDNPTALDALERVITPPHGGDRRSEDFKRDNITLETERGTSGGYALRRLRKDRPDLHAQVLAGEKTPHGAMVEAGLRRKTMNVPMDDVTALARRLRAALSDGDCRRLVGLLQDDPEDFTD